MSRDSWKPYASAIFGQLQKASLSVELNIAEGYSFGDTRSFTRHLGVAYGSAVETAELLRLGLEAEVIPDSSGRPLLDHANHACRLLVGLLKRRRRFSA